MGDIEFCDVDHGKEIPAYNFMRKMLYALWWACDKTVDVLQLVSKFILLLLPSGVKIPLMLDGEVPKFYESMPEQKFWGFNIRMKILGMDPINLCEVIPFPVEGYKNAFQNWISPWDVYVGDGEYVYFEDSEGNWKPGKDFVPPKRYGVLAHGTFDAASIFIIVGIVNILRQAGFFKTAKLFVSKMFGTYSSVRKTLRSIRQRRQIDKLVDRIDVTSVDKEFGLVTGKIGLRGLFG